MNVENVDVLVSRLGELVSQSKAAISFLNKFKNADGVVPTLTAEQKADAMATVSGLAPSISSAYQLATDAFTATDKVV